MVICDELGKSWNTIQLSNFLKKNLENPLVKTIIFAIGGPYGFSLKTKEKSNFIFSLSNLTLPNEMAWILLCEQIYRAFTILEKMPYHHR